MRILLLMVIGLAAVAGEMPEVPEMPAGAAAVARATNTWFFAATAMDTGGLESDFSSEVSFSHTGSYGSVTLAWDPPAPAVTGLTYRVYVGSKSRAYTNVYSAGSNLSTTVPLGSAPKTNRVFTLRAVSSTNTAGPWAAFTNWPAFSITNPVRNLYYRVAVGLTNF